MNTKIKLVVIEEHTLGYINPDSKYAGVLHASILKGASSSCPLSAMNPILLGDSKKIRLASEKDFDDFRVFFGAFGNKEVYEFAEN